MLARSYIRTIPFFLAVWAYLIPSLTLPHNAFRFIGNTEILFPILLIPLCSFILYDRTEIELALVSGTRTSKLFFTKLAPFITYTVIPSTAFALMFPSYTVDKVDPSIATLKAIPEHVPNNYKLLTAASLVVTVLFFVALYSLVRVITRNCYIPILVCFGLSIGIRGFSASIVAMRVSLTNCLFDPFINSYFIGNSVPNVYAEKFPELASMANAWTHNRLLFIGISVLLFFITYLILRREKLHRGIGE